MAEEALLDAPVDEQVDTGTETSNESSETTSNEVPEQSSNETQQQDDSAPVIADANGQLKLSEKARAELDRIKAENPKLAREMRAALFDRQTLLSKVPGGVKEALATIEAYEAEGGSEAVQALKKEAEDYSALVEVYNKDPQKFVAEMVGASSEAFTKLAPAVMEKFAEMAPANFTHEISKVFAQDMAASDIPLNLKLLRRELEDPANPGKVKAGMQPIADIYNALQAYADRINGYAKNAPKVEAKPNEANPTETATDNSLTTEQFQWEKTKIKESATKAAFEQNAGNRKIPAEKISVIEELYESALNRMVESIPGHKAKVDRFLAAKDKAGYAKHMAAAIKEKAPLAMEQAFRKAGVGAKPGPQAKPADKPAITAAKPADTTGWTRVAVKPAKDTIAHWKMTAKMLKEGKYILRDGKQVIYNGR